MRVTNMFKKFIIKYAKLFHKFGMFIVQNPLLCIGYIILVTVFDILFGDIITSFIDSLPFVYLLWGIAFLPLFLYLLGLACQWYCESVGVSYND